MALNKAMANKWGYPMKLTKLLTGAAVAAIMTGAATAQVPSQIVQGEFTTVANTSGTPTVGDVWFASEVGSIANIVVPAEFQIAPAATAPAAGFSDDPNVEVLLTVTISGAVLDRSLVDADIVGTGGCATGDLTVDANGAAGDNAVTFRIADIADCDAATGFAATPATDNFQFALPLILSGGDVNISYEMRRASNNNLITSGTWVGNETNAVFGAGANAGPFITQVSALNVTSTSANSFAVADVTAGPAYSAFTDATAGSVTIGFSGALKADRTAVAIGDVVAATSGYNCTFASTAGLDQDAHTFLGANGAAGNTSNPVPFAFATGTAALSLVSLGTVGILPQDISCSGSANYAAASGLSPSSFSFDAGRIRRDGLTTDTFEWTGDGNAVTRSIFRITGLGASAPAASVIISNSSNGMDGEYPITLGTPSNGEVIVTNSAIAAAVGGSFGRGDVQFSLQLDGATNDVVIRRLLVGQNGTLSGFGNENDDDADFVASDVPSQGSVGGGDN